MKISQISESSITLNLPKKQRILGFILLIVGFIIPILLYFLNNYQISLSTSLGLKSLIQSLSFWSFLGGFVILGLLGVYYFLTIRNSFTALGHIMLLIINTIAYIASYSSIYTFSPVLITGLYFLTHFKSITCEKSGLRFKLSERIFFIFHTQISIPFNEIQKFTLDYRGGFRLLKRSKTPHQFRLILHLFEKDPGFGDTPVTLEPEKDSLEFFRPQTLRNTLISNPFLINSSLFNWKDKDLIQMRRLAEQMSRLMDFSLAEEKVLGNKKVMEYKIRDA
jgi:hypothetical protein